MEWPVQRHVRTGEMIGLMIRIRDMISKQLPQLKGTIFVVTYGRSGSTALQGILQTIPGAHITGENYMALEGLFIAAKRLRRADRTWGKKPRPKAHPWYGADLFKPKRFETRLADVFIEEVIQPPSDARWIGFKEIRYQRLGGNLSEFLAFCERSFPNPFFVFNSRNAEDVAKSKWWANQPRERVLELVAAMDARFAEYVEAHPTRSHRVFHEQTVSDPTSLQPLFDKLGEPLDLDAAGTILATPLTH